MNAWGRLLWKEYRESIAILIVGILLPLAMISLREKLSMLYPAVGLISILITLWAVNRVQAGIAGHTRARTLLPVSPVVRWTAMFFFPILVPLLAGLSVGFMMIHFDIEGSTPVVFRMTGTTLFMLANFMLCTALAAILSPIPAIMAGVFWLFVGFDPVSVWTNVPLFLLLIAGSLLASVVWEVLSLRQRYLAGRICALLLLAGITCGPLLINKSLFQSGGGDDQYRTEWRVFDLTPPGSSREIYADMVNKTNDEYDSPLSLNFYDRRLGHSQRREFPQRILPLDFLDQDRVLLAQQSRDAMLHLLEWDTTEDQVREVMQLSVGRNALLRYDFSLLSPDGRYLVIAVGSQVGPGRDLWLVDLQQRRARIILPNNPILDGYYYERNVAWLGDRMILSGIHDISVEVDLRTLRGHVLNYPSAGRTR